MYETGKIFYVEFAQITKITKRLMDKSSTSFQHECRANMLFMIESFKKNGTADIFDGINSKAARKLCPESIWRVAVRKLDQIDSASTIDELAVPPGNHLEKLSGDREDQYSIRINDQYRICFTWSELGAEQVEIVDYH
jgi:toxin HigB-1